MNQAPWSPPPPVSFTPNDLLNMRLALDQIKHPNHKIKACMDNLDSIIHSIVMGLSAGPSTPLPVPPSSN